MSISGLTIRLTVSTWGGAGWGGGMAVRPGEKTGRVLTSGGDMCADGERTI